MQFPVIIGLVILNLLCVSTLYAGNTQERAYALAEKAIQKGSIRDEKEIAHLKDYPLYPYLAAQLFLQKQGTHKLSDFLKFQHRFRDLPIFPSIMEKWMDTQRAKKQWQNLLALEIPKEQYSLRCLQANAYFTTNQKISKETLLELWENAIPAGSACLALFKTMYQKNLLNEQHIHARLEKSFIKKPHAAKELLPLLSEKLAQLTKAHIEAQENPKETLHKSHTLPKHPLRAHVIARAFSVLAKKDLDFAMHWYTKLKKQALLPTRELEYAYKEIALQLARQQKAEALHWMNALPQHLRDEQFSEWHIRAALKESKWPLVLKLIEQLPNAMYHEPRWQYWLARSYGELGQEKKAKQIYKKIAPKRNFYSFLASEHLHLPHHLEHEKSSVTESELAKAKKMPWFLRMKEFTRLGKHKEAQTEWHYAKTILSDRQLLAVAQLLYQSGQYYQALSTLSKSQLKNDIQLRFPLAHLTHVSTAAQKHSIEPAWIYAITRQESAFRMDAKSPVGALGLMQLMPETAKFIAQKIQHPYRTTTELYRADVNLKLGTAYFESLKKMMRGNPILATAAYNAGPGRIQRWLPEKPLAADLWIETIPYAETREYVANVLAYLSIYGHLLGQPTRLSKWMTPIAKFK